MGWLPWPLIPKRQWARGVYFKDQRAITWEEQSEIVAREKNPETRTFYQLAWHQSDLAKLQATVSEIVGNDVENSEEFWRRV
jgi:hypothetical protein